MITLKPFEFPKIPEQTYLLAEIVNHDFENGSVFVDFNEPGVFFIKINDEKGFIAFYEYDLENIDVINLASNATDIKQFKKTEVRYIPHAKVEIVVTGLT